MNNPRMKYDNYSILSCPAEIRAETLRNFQWNVKAVALQYCRKGTDVSDTQEENKGARACSLRVRISFLDIERGPFSPTCPVRE